MNESSSISGLLKRIVSHETIHNSTSRPSGQPVLDTKVITNIEIETDDKKIIPIGFGSHIGYELLGQKVTYSQSVDVIANQAAHVCETTRKQSLIPENPSLPKYVASDCAYIQS